MSFNKSNVGERAVFTHFQDNPFWRDDQDGCGVLKPCDGGPSVKFLYEVSVECWSFSAMPPPTFREWDPKRSGSIPRWLSLCALGPVLQGKRHSHETGSPGTCDHDMIDEVEIRATIAEDMMCPAGLADYITLMVERFLMDGLTHSGNHHYSCKF